MPEAGRAEYLLGSLEGPVQSRLRQLEAERWPERIQQRDASLWQGAATSRLGWLSAPDQLRGHLSPIRRLIEKVRADGLTHSIVLGMGGSALAPACLTRTFGAGPGALIPSVLDSTVPAEIRSREAELPLAKTLFIVSSKSGHTVETNAFYSYFEERIRMSGQKSPGRHFVAITDEGSPLGQLASQSGFRHCSYSPPDIGGRYSALSVVGILPAALAGVDVETLLARGSEMVRASENLKVRHNPPLHLGAALAEAALAGHDKVTLIASDKLPLFGAWAEQLVAESTGKAGKGLIPIDGEPITEGDHYGDDRLFVGLLLGDSDPLEPKLRALAGPTRPLVLIKLRDPLDLGGEFFRWELAVAVAGAILGIDPFDEPYVAESKQNVGALLKKSSLGAGPTFSGPVRAIDAKGEVKLATAALQSLLKEVGRGDYLCLQAFLPEYPAVVGSLQQLRLRLRDRTKAASTLGFGPRFLHSTGQLHKGGPNSGVFIQITGTASVVGSELPIPGSKYGFGRLLAAEAEGDRRSLRAQGRRLLHLELADARAGLEEVGRSV